jgi:hypothetical protein
MAQWFSQVVRGYFQYHAVPENLTRMVSAARYCVAGFVRYGVAASVDAVAGNASSRVLRCCFPLFKLCIPIPRHASTPNTRSEVNRMH